MSVSPSIGTSDIAARAKAAREQLDAHTHEIVQWHFHPSTGCPFWLENATQLKFDPLKEIRTFDDLKKFEPFEDEWLRGGPVRRWVPKAFADKPIYVFETGGTTGIPKSRIAIDDFRTDYSLFSQHAARRVFSPGVELADARPLRPAAAAAGGRAPGPVPRRHLLLHRSRSALGDQAHQEGLDGAPRSLQAALHRPGDHDPRRRPRHQVHVHHAQAARGPGAGAGEARHDAFAKSGITGIFSGGTEFTPQWTRFATEEFLDGVYMTPTYGNTLMGLACSQAGHGRRRTTRSVLRPAAAGRDRGRRFQRLRPASSATARRAA